MSSNWIFSTTFLPYTGEPIDFRLEDRVEPIHGTFANGTFHSRWAEYEVGRVPSWRQAISDPAHEAIAALPDAKGHAWFAPMARFARLFRFAADGAAVEVAQRRTTIRPGPVARASSVANGRPNSNQISS